MSGLGIRQRLLAVLDYDGIAACRRATHLSEASGLSKSSARRWLSNDDAADKMGGRCLHHLAQGLDVDLIWLLTGGVKTFKPRTARIFMQQVKGYPAYEVDRVMRLFVATCAGHRKADNLVRLVVADKLSLRAAASLL